MNKKICTIQINYTDLENFDANYNCIAKLKESGIFDKVVLAAPDIEKNLVLADFARKYDIELFLGEVDNVAKRMLDCCRKYDAEIAARVLINWFFIDIDLIKAMIQMLQDTGADYVNLPRNFDIRFGADVFHSRFLVKLLDSRNPDIQEGNAVFFNPWGYAETHPENCHLVTCQETPEYSYDDFNKIRETFRKVWPERHDSSCAPMYTYKSAVNYIKSKRNCRVLDVACGLGNGTNYLAYYCEEIVGVDSDEDTIVKAKESFPKTNIEFVAGDAQALSFPEESFDAIVSVHTMEHLPDDDRFLQRCSAVLCSDGIFIIEVPKLRELPFKGVDTPLSVFHIREYDAEGFAQLLDKHFDVIELLGACRRFYVSIENSREALFAVCRKKNKLT